MFFMCIYDPTIGGSGAKHDEYKLLVPRHQQYRADGVVYPMTIYLVTMHTMEFLASLHLFGGSCVVQYSSGGGCR